MILPPCGSKPNLVGRNSFNSRDGCRFFQRRIKHQETALPFSETLARFLRLKTPLPARRAGTSILQPQF
jgi:hypothetical protein